jgi:hypothetical protein
MQRHKIAKLSDIVGTVDTHAGAHS